MIQYYPRAAPGKRFIAAAVDALAGILPLLTVAALILAPLYALFTRPETAWADRFSAEAVVALYAALPVSLIWFCFYSLLRDGFGEGQSWGKKLCGLMVIDLSCHQPCDRKSSFDRNYLGFSLALFTILLPVFAPVLPLVEPFCIALDERGLRTGDRWAGTQVIDCKDRHYYSTNIDGMNGTGSPARRAGISVPGRIRQPG